MSLTSSSRLPFTVVAMAADLGITKFVRDALGAFLVRGSDPIPAWVRKRLLARFDNEMTLLDVDTLTDVQLLDAGLSGSAIRVLRKVCQEAVELTRQTIPANWGTGLTPVPDAV